MAGDVEGFSDHIQPRYVAGFHGFGGDVVRVHAAEADFGLVEALGGGRGYGEAVDALAGGFDLLFGELADLGFGQVRVQEQGGSRWAGWAATAGCAAGRWTRGFRPKNPPTTSRAGSR